MQLCGNKLFGLKNMSQNCGEDFSYFQGSEHFFPALSVLLIARVCEYI